MPIGNQLMRARVDTYNISRKVLEPKIFNSKEINFGLFSLDVLLFFYLYV